MFRVVPLDLVVILLKVHQIEAFYFKMFKKYSRGDIPLDPPRGCDVHPSFYCVFLGYSIDLYLFYCTILCLGGQLKSRLGQQIV